MNLLFLAFNKEAERFNELNKDLKRRLDDEVCHKHKEIEFLKAEQGPFADNHKRHNKEIFHKGEERAALFF